MIKKWSRTKKNKILIFTVVAALATYSASYRLLGNGWIPTVAWLISGAYLVGFAYANRK